MGIEDVVAAGAGAVGLGIVNDQRQINQQQKLQDMQIAGQKQMGLFNQGLAIDTWNKTNYPAQRAQMEKAGLNVGLMYGMGGGGGATTNTPTGNVTGAMAPSGGNEAHMAMDKALQMELQKAQIQNIEADTKVKEAEIPVKGTTADVNTAKVGEIGASIDNIKAQTATEQSKKALTDYQAANEELKLKIGQMTQWDVITQIATNTETLITKLRSDKVQAFKDEATRDTAIQQIKQNAVEQQMRIAAQQAGINVDNATVQKVSAEIANMLQQRVQEGMKIDQDRQKIEIQKILASFQTSTPEQIKQWTSIITDIMRAGAAVAGAAK
ncbi:MAG: DNA pilot protein [Microviridae sp.]|nr:MAG: DNA pilot protein [Microviridae sp.]